MVLQTVLVMHIFSSLVPPTPLALGCAHISRPSNVLERTHREEDYERASIIKKQIVEVVEAIDALEADMDLGGVPQDELTWVRLLTMINELLTHTKKNLKHPGLMVPPIFVTFSNPFYLVDARVRF
jgi:hypothetical protein